MGLACWRSRARILAQASDSANTEAETGYLYVQFDMVSVRLVRLPLHWTTPHTCGITIPMPDLKHVTIYTDGACLGNPGPGGYGVILIFGKHRRELSGGFRLTTNNRMELTACIEGLSALKERCQVNLYTDSQYISDAINEGWAVRWRARGWKRNHKDKAQNPDLWARLLDLIAQHEVTVAWLRGHAGHAENERADFLSVLVSQQPDLPGDAGYETREDTPTSGGTLFDTNKGAL